MATFPGHFRKAPPNPTPYSFREKEVGFSAWFEVFLGGRWYTFDARHNTPRIGRIVIARGRDATDVPMLNSFGRHWLQRFEVTTDEIIPERQKERTALPVSRQRWHDREQLQPTANAAA